MVQQLTHGNMKRVARKGLFRLSFDLVAFARPLSMALVVWQVLLTFRLRERTAKIREAAYAQACLNLCCSHMLEWFFSHDAA